MRKHLLGRSESKQQRKVKKKKRLERKTKGKKVARKRSDLFGFVKMLDVILLKFNILFFKINYSCKIFFWVVIYKFLYSQSFLFLQTFSFSKKELHRKCFLLNIRSFANDCFCIYWIQFYNSTICQCSPFHATCLFLYTPWKRLKTLGAAERHQWHWTGLRSNPASIYLLKVNNRNTRAKVWSMFKVNNEDTKTTPWRRFGVFIVNFEHILHLCSSISIVNFEQVNADWEDLQIVMKIIY